jgi:CHAD domain-containing protein
VKRSIKRYKRIQSALGDYQDTVVAPATVRRIAVNAGTTEGENGFSAVSGHDNGLRRDLLQEMLWASLSWRV